MIIVPMFSERAMLAKVLNREPQEDLILRLYRNDWRPSRTDTAGKYTEPGFAGYAGLRVLGSEWNFEVGEITTAIHDDVTFKCGKHQEPEPVFGYYMTGSDSGALYWVERFDDGPYVVRNAGDKINVCLRVSLTQPPYLGRTLTGR